MAGTNDGEGRPELAAEGCRRRCSLRERAGNAADAPDEESGGFDSVATGVLAIAVRSIGFTSKLISEAIEEIDHGQVEGIRATGASPLEVAIYGIVPQIKPAFVGVATYRWDINVRASTIIGFVGAGGIGVQLTTSINFFRWQNVLTILLAILAIVVFSEVTSAYLRRKVR